MSIRVRGLIFDYGNVLCGHQVRAEVDGMAAIFGASVPAFEKAYWEPRDVFDAARLTPEEYWGGIAKTLGRELTAAMLAEAIERDNRSWSAPSPVMARWADAVRARGVRTAILSNMPVTLRRNLAAWVPAFDHETFSCDLRTGKPRPEIFEHCLAGLGTVPGETLFLDDREENTRGAAALGIHTILFRDAAQAQREIAGRFELPLPIVA